MHRLTRTQNTIELKAVWKSLQRCKDEQLWYRQLPPPPCNLFLISIKE